MNDEIARLRADRTEMSQLYAAAVESRNEDREENARLRAELEKYGPAYRYALDVSKKQQATIDRVRALCDSEEASMIDPDKAKVRTSVIRAILED